MSAGSRTYKQPVMLPSRVDAGLMAWLSGLSRPVVFVQHANHPNEIDAEVIEALPKLRDAGVMLLTRRFCCGASMYEREHLAGLSNADCLTPECCPYYLMCLRSSPRPAAHSRFGGAARLLAGELAAQLPGYSRTPPRAVRSTAPLPK